MTTQNIKKHVDNIINATFETLQDVYKKSKEGATLNGTLSRIIFPHYSTKDHDEQKKIRIRLSEQELRFVFVEKFNQYCAFNNLPWYYSVETPTKEKHSFTGSTERSGEMDLNIHDQSSERIAMIEFKFKDTNPGNGDYHTDFEKLKKEPIENRFFVMFVRDDKDGTIDKLCSDVEQGCPDTMFYCYSLADGGKFIAKPKLEEQPNV